MTTEELEEQESEEEQSRGFPWISGITAFTKYGKSIKQLKELVRQKKLRSRKVNGTDHFSVEDLEKLGADGDEEASPAIAMADLVRAARDQLAQVQTHHEKMFDKYMGAFDKVLETQNTTIGKQNEHIIEMEKQALAMREAAEKVFNLENERRLGEIREQRKEAIQKAAIDNLMKFAGPWIAKKMGSQMGEAAPSAEAGGTDPRLSQLGSAVVDMAVSMTDEKFAELGRVIPEAEFAVLQMIRESSRQ